MNARAILEEILRTLKEKETPEVMSIDQLSKYLGLSRRFLEPMIATYKVPFTPFGSRKRFKKSEIDQWLKSRTVHNAVEHRTLIDGRRRMVA